jgi:hypothetical protein
MATLAEIRAAIVARLAGVAGIGVVHDRQRFGKRDADLKALYQSGAILQGWHVRRVATKATKRGISGVSIHHAWRIFGVRSFDDDGASEIAFDASIEAIRAAFAADDTLGGLVHTCILRNPDAQVGIAVLDAGPVLFAGVLCHGAELSLDTLDHQ